MQARPDQLEAMPKDGACMYHAVACGLQWMSGKKKTKEARFQPSRSSHEGQ